MFLSRRYRPNKWPFYVLLAFEFPLTVALLALFGIAAPNLYRTKLWQDGADNGFNSSPLTGLYAAANYRPYTTPKVWSQFITNYNVVIAVLSMFLMLVKSIMYMLHVFPPILSAPIHAVLVALYTVSVYYQASSDTSDRDRPQDGPPWYITKNCSVARNKSLIGYCQQAKASFACTVAMLGIFAIYMGFAMWSCFPSKTQRLEYEQRKKEREERWGKFEDAEEPKPTARTNTYPVPETPGYQGGLNPITPRTLAFNTLGGTTNDLPLRNRSASPEAAQPVPSNITTIDTSNHAPTSFAIRSPDFPRSPLNFGFNNNTATANTPPEASQSGTEPRTTSPPPPKMYFPPPPKKAIK